MVDRSNGDSVARVCIGIVINVIIKRAISISCCKNKNVAQATPTISDPILQSCLSLNADTFKRSISPAIIVDINLLILIGERFGYVRIEIVASSSSTDSGSSFSLPKIRSPAKSALGATPATPVSLLALAAATPATEVP